MQMRQKKITSQQKSSQLFQEPRRFRRSQKNNSRSRSNSNRSESQSISKFYIKNISQKLQGKNQSQIQKQLFKSKASLFQTAKNKKFQSSHKNQALETATSLHQNKEKLQKLCLQRMQINTSDFGQALGDNIINFTLQELHQNIRRLGQQLMKSEQQKENLKMQNIKFKNFINNLRLQPQKQDSKLTLKKLKKDINIFKMNQVKEQNSNLKAKIAELEKTIDQLRMSTSSILKKSQLSQISLQLGKDLSCQESFVRINFNETYQKLESQLREARQEITKLHIHYHSELRKLTKQKEQIIQKKNQQYIQLKNKFIKYLRQYNKRDMKNSSIFLKGQLIESKIESENTQESILLNLSSDQEIQ